MILVLLRSLGLSTISSAAPLGLAALGGLATAASGSLSIALEGSMLVGAFTAGAVCKATGIIGLAMAAGALAGLVLSLFVGLATIGLAADVFVAGLAANILAPVEVQCQWLREIGFTDVDCYLKMFEVAVFGGRRP